MSPTQYVESGMIGIPALFVIVGLVVDKMRTARAKRAQSKGEPWNEL